jgi:predicted GH43/DUF377 family glycosyl hydrolase
MCALPDDLTSRIETLVPRLEGWCTIQKALALAECIHRFRPACCVEIGVYGGRSLLPQAMACRHIAAGQVFGIDPWSAKVALIGLQAHEDLEFWGRLDYESVYRGCLQALLDERLTDVCTLIRVSAEKAAPLFDRIDLLHIDGNHSAEMALRDVQLYLPRVSPGGHIWFDDVDWDSTNLAVEMLRRECDLVLDFGNYAWFRKKAAVCPPMNWDGENPSQTSDSQADSGRIHPERKILAYSTDPALTEFPGGLYNPGGAIVDGRFFLLARNERHLETHRELRKALCRDDCRPLAFQVELDGRVSELRPFEPPRQTNLTRIEDFRLFHHGGSLSASYSAVFWSHRIENRVSEVDLENNRLGPPRQPLVDFPLQPIEKNWCYFENAGDLYALYSFRPFRLLKCVDRAEFRFETVAFGTPSAFQDVHEFQAARFVSWSTSPVEFDDHGRLAFVHWRDRDLNYRHFGVLIDRVSGRPTHIARTPLFVGGQALGVHPHVVYLSSVLYHGGYYWFFLGEGDEHVSACRLSAADIQRYMARSTPLDFTPRDPDDSIAGPYVYEHCGAFLKEIDLRPDGTIFPEGEHERHWRLRRLDGGEPELWILGAGQVSCCMRQGNGGIWRGIWKWGDRPVAQLIRIQYPDGITPRTAHEFADRR